MLKDFFIGILVEVVDEDVLVRGSVVWDIDFRKFVYVIYIYRGEFSK